MRTVSGALLFAKRPPFVVQAAHFTASAHYSKAKRNPVNPRLIESQITSGAHKPLLSPLPAKAQAEDPNTESRNQSPSLRTTVRDFLRYYRKYIIYWAVGSAAWYLFVGICYIRNHEVVPITGRGRFNGPWLLSKVYAGEQEDTETGSDGLYFPHDLESAVLTGRVRTVLQRIAFAAGLGDVRWRVHLLPSRELPQASLHPAHRC